MLASQPGASDGRRVKTCDARSSDYTSESEPGRLHSSFPSLCTLARSVIRQTTTRFLVRLIAATSDRTNTAKLAPEWSLHIDPTLQRLCGRNKLPGNALSPASIDNGSLELAGHSPSCYVTCRSSHIIRSDPSTHHDAPGPLNHLLVDEHGVDRSAYAVHVGALRATKELVA